MTKAPDAEEGVDADHIDWADVIFVMERSHRAKLNRRFRDRLRGKRIICLDDDYALIGLERTAAQPSSLRDPKDGAKRQRVRVG